MRTYKTVFIDWDGTLSNSRFWARWGGTERYDLIQRILFTTGRDDLEFWMKGTCSYSDVLKRVEQKTDIPFRELEDELRYSAEHMQLINSAALTLVARLRAKGVKVVIATDNMDTFELWTVPALHLDTLFDEVLLSYTLKALKSECASDGTSKFFGHYLNQNSIDPSETVLIDNSLDLKSVEAFGMDFLHVNEKQSLVDHLRQLTSTR